MYPKVSLQSRLSRESCNAKFCKVVCAQNYYGVTLTRGDVAETRSLMFIMGAFICSIRV